MRMPDDNPSLVVLAKKNVYPARFAGLPCGDHLQVVQGGQRSTERLTITPPRERGCTGRVRRSEEDEYV